jgi:hypothetical protein
MRVSTVDVTGLRTGGPSSEAAVKWQINPLREIEGLILPQLL